MKAITKISELRTRLSPCVMQRSITTSLFVGSALALSNHYGLLFGEPVTTARFIQIILCYLIPLLVSMYSQCALLRSQGTGLELRPFARNVKSKNNDEDSNIP